jgi:hypothetical protein
MISSNLRDRLRRIYLMREAIANADRFAKEAGQGAFASCRNARALLGAAESLEDGSEWQLGTIALLHQAAMFAAQGLGRRRPVVAEVSDMSAVWNAVGELPEVQPTIQALSVETRERISKLVATGSMLDYADWSLCELRTLGQSLLGVVRCLVLLLEADLSAPRRLRFQRALRWIGSLLGIMLLVAYAGWKIHRRGVVVNLALNQTVEVSSHYRADLYRDDTLVDGDKTQLGCHTESEHHPWARIDLGGKQTIRRVVVTNRLDGLTERAVPLLIETSLDGRNYEEFARKTEVFKTWTADGAPTKARYVRLMVLADNILHLNEVEVY